MDLVDQARAEVAALEAKAQMKGITVKLLLQKLQALVRADKTVLAGAIVSGAVALAAAFKFHVSGEAVAVISTIVNVGLAWFVNQNYKAKLAAAKLLAKE
jgi:hypothetical protein